MRRKSASERYYFLTSENLCLRKLGSERIVHVLKASMIVHSCLIRDGWSRELFVCVFPEDIIRVHLLYSARFLKSYLRICQAIARIT